MTRRLCLITTFLLLSQALFFTIPNVIADDTSQTANAILDGETITEWICSPDCGSETVDAIDWYTITLQANQPAQIFIENLDDFSAVELSASLFLGNDSNLNSSVNIGSNDNNSLSINVQQETQLFISIEANDGFSHDGTNYSITLLVETDNHATSATPIEVGNFLDVGYVCIADCPGGVVDSEDWYYFSVNSETKLVLSPKNLLGSVILILNSTSWIVKTIPFYIPTSTMEVVQEGLKITVFVLGLMLLQHKTFMFVFSLTNPMMCYTIYQLVGVSGLM